VYGGTLVSGAKEKGHVGLQVMYMTPEFTAHLELVNN
jgi:hypothetical protein